jgi:CIC family chloride channel protein
MPDIDALRMIPVAGPEAHAPELSNSNSIRHLLQHAGHFLIAEMTIREAIDVFDRAEAEELAVVESNGTVRVVGLLNEAYALRRCAAASDLRRRELTGTI